MSWEFPEFFSEYSGIFLDFFEFSWDKSKSRPTAGWVDESAHKPLREGFMALQWLFTPWADSVNATEALGVVSELRCRPHFYVAKRFEQMVKVLKRRKKASFEKVKV